MKKMKTNKNSTQTPEAIALNENLNILLAGLQVFYQNMRSFHWNIRGKHFFELHTRFEALYTETQQLADSVAERILMRGESPLSSFSDFVAKSPIAEAGIQRDGEQSVSITVSNLSALIEQETKVLHAAVAADDEVSNSLVSDMLSLHEKHRWMYSAWLS